ncbi:MAG: TIGR04372 family glycosyltransferase [Thalassobaculaceae bacterium]|nr:TIGR04372 family glycosyltransferase [Thalassobaculaceae bacterium]
MAEDTVAQITARTALLVRPDDPEAIENYVVVLGAPEQAYRWFRRRLVASTSMIAADVYRKAIKATAVIGLPELRNLVNSASAGDSRAQDFVGAALLAAGRLDSDALRAKPALYSAGRDNFERLMSIVSATTVPTSFLEAFRIMVEKQGIAAALNGAGYFDLATVIGRDLSTYIRRIRRNLYGTGFRGFTHKWTNAIGHMVVLAFLIRGQSAGLMDFDGVRIWEGKAANPYLWERMRALSDNLEIVPRWSIFADNHLSIHSEWMDSAFVDYFEACGIIADRAGSADGGILARPAAADPTLKRFFSETGIAPASRVVTLHMRGGGYRDLRGAGYRPGRGNDLRNAPIASVVPALKMLVRQGYRVVRLGDASMEPLPPVDGVFDYAVSDLKTPELDVLLPGAAAFHIGSSSGLSLVPLLFGTPCLYLNWHPVELLPWGRANWTVLKPIETLEDGRAVVDKASVSRLGRLRDRRLLTASGFDIRDLTAAEIVLAVKGFVASRATGNPGKTGRNLSRILVMNDDGTLRDLS